MLLIASARAAGPADGGDPRFKADLLVVLAHPDDETAIGSYLARAALDEHRRVAVVYTTRGDAGESAVGPERGLALGAIRELEGRRALATLGVSTVWFLAGHDQPGQDPRASLGAWDHEAVLGVVRLVRLTRPAVVITWLPALVVGENHGDHQAAGVVATEAFDLAGSPLAFPGQLGSDEDWLAPGSPAEGLRPWQPWKLYFFSDARDPAPLLGRGPRYDAEARSPTRGSSYAALEAAAAAAHLTQLGPRGAAVRAAATGDLAPYLAERRRLLGAVDVTFVLGKTLVAGTAADANLFAGLGAAPFTRPIAPPAPPSALPAPPPASPSPSFTLGGPWGFYRIVPTRPTASAPSRPWPTRSGCARGRR